MEPASQKQGTQRGLAPFSNTEVAILKAWAWEEAHRDKDGPAHRLFREHGIDVGQPLALLHAADLELPNEEVLGDRIVMRRERGHPLVGDHAQQVQWLRLSRPLPKAHPAGP